jgi:ABC-type multidrug transport system fused ATPase/permease subunit
MNELSIGLSRKVLLRLAGALLILAAILALNLDFLKGLYFSDQLTVVGWIINGAIVVLFLTGLAKTAGLLLRYAREEAALRKLVTHIEDGYIDVLKGINSNSLITRRYQLLQRLNEQHAAVNHAALASTLLARESTRLSFPRFVNGILILMGVLGTIISLSIALLGASHLLDVSQGMGGDMGMVIHGMSTAMSTTITAIVSFLFYGYFYLKLTDVQTHFLGNLEQATTLYLMPKFSGSEESMLADIRGLVGSLHEVSRQMEHAQTHYTEAGSQLRDIVARLGADMNAMSQDVDEIKTILRDGFRLPARDEE